MSELRKPVTLAAKPTAGGLREHQYTEYATGTPCKVIAEKDLEKHTGKPCAAALVACRDRMQRNGLESVFVELDGGVCCLSPDDVR